MKYITYIKSLAEDVEGHLNANDLQPTFRVLKKLIPLQMISDLSAFLTADGCLVSVPASVCMMSVCMMSVCMMSVCMMSVCMMSVCMMSVCMMSVCMMSVCMMSVCMMSVCMMSVCMMSVCVVTVYF